ncbi:hypothetical protein BCR39DRAFT_531954 [Naematelia encephala]|uniref:Protein UNC80 C-terminal domain-containing protein n=1 Tax=Naematelia encephala TaxID=71784 RepID=A0A1Y2B3W2_9TREE|nr:hypothetical protein BCR39DRAFT_531954 [Naematelia encephala]
MAELPSPPITPRARARVPSGPRPLRGSPTASRVTSTSSVPIISNRASTERLLRGKPSLSSLAPVDSSPSAFLDEQYGITESPESSPKLRESDSFLIGQRSRPREGHDSYPTGQSSSSRTAPLSEFPVESTAAPSGSTDRIRDAPVPSFHAISTDRPSFHAVSTDRLSHAVSTDRPSTPSSFSVSRPTTPVSSHGARSKPKPSRLNTVNLLHLPSSSPSRPVSPGLKHWQQVRSHVMAPSPIEERSSGKNKKIGLVSKAAGRFGFRHAAENVIGYEDRRRSLMGLDDLGGLSAEQREEMARERRRFAREVKACLDACSLEESHRRLWRLGRSGRGDEAIQAGSHPSGSNSTHKTPQANKHTGPSVHKHSAPLSVHTSRFTFDPDFSAFAPLLTELHRHLPAARAKRLWSRTCPHHAAILAELGVAFLPDGSSTSGERQQALEVFGVIVKHWASDNADEELTRWLWLCRALLIDDRQLRNRGLSLLASFLHSDPALPSGPDRPHSAAAFLRIATALVSLVHAIERAEYDATDHLRTVRQFIVDLAEGDILGVDQLSIIDMLGGKDVQGSMGGIEKELVWLAVTRALGQDVSLAKWLISDGSSHLQRFAPPPLLHATPPVILHLRALATISLLSSFTTLIRTSAPPKSTMINDLWDATQDLLIPVIDHLPNDDEFISDHLGAFLLELEMAHHCSVPRLEHGALDPFHITAPVAEENLPSGHRETIVTLMAAPGPWKSGIDKGVKSCVAKSPLAAVVRLLQSFLSAPAFLPLARDSLPIFFSRLSPTSSDTIIIRPFLLYLVKSHPQLLYKPLFSLSASTSATSLSARLNVVRTISTIVGASIFWTRADPQMVVIVLMGDVVPKESKGKGKEGERRIVNVKLGRYAVLAELITALHDVNVHGKGSDGFKGFAEILEQRLGSKLDAEEKEASLPSGYRNLMCALFEAMRLKTMSLRRSAWQKLVLRWFVEAESESETDAQLDILKTVQKATVVADSKGGSPSVKDVSELELPPYRCNLASLLVIVHACLSNDDWTTSMPHFWDRLGREGQNTKALVFLLMKCAEIIPAQLQKLVTSELTHRDSRVRRMSLCKLTILFAWRFQVLSQPVLTDRRGPIFHFPIRTSDFVATEIGSATWVPPHDIQDAQLQKFGTALPLELRQRLMELGWTEDASIAGKSDWEQTPVSSLPSLHYQLDSTMGSDGGEGKLSPMKSLMRKGSSGSGVSYQGKRRKAVFAPLIMGLVNEQALLLAQDIDGLTNAVSKELVRLVQRDEPIGLLRPLTDGFGTSFPTALGRLNAVSVDLTPAFAHGALNALVGHLKMTLRTDPTYLFLPAALATASRLISNVSEMSLRDIRKNKAEHVLLPASIHEEEGGFKLHGPWRDGQIEVQTAQLLILAAILKANPRDVYLVKKMLSNLQIQASITSISFARAWLLLIVDLFSTVNRNYNDRAELRHFLSNVAAILRLHGSTDMLITSHAMRIFILCSARFRRLFASMGFSTIMRAVYEVYAAGHSAIRDCIEYCARSFYRIHQDNFVYQVCVVISEGEYEPGAVYGLLASLSRGNSAVSGVASGIRGLNDREEMDTLVHMISGPEISLSEIGTAASERQASKLAAITLEDDLFPRENIVKLFFTVIAANPATPRASNFLRLLSGLIPHVTDQPSQELLREGVEALGEVVLRGKTGDEAAMMAFHPGEDGTQLDWVAARREYISLVESFARSGGQLGAPATRRTLDMVLDLLRKQPGQVGPAAASILRELAKTHLAGPRPAAFLKDIAPMFRSFMAVVDFSGVLDSITSLIQRSHFDIDVKLADLIVDSYVGPSLRLLSNAAEDNMAFILPLRTSAVNLLCAAVFVRGDALATLERLNASSSILASVVLPFCLQLEQPTQIDRDEVYNSIWIRLLHFVIRPRRSVRSTKTVAGRSLQDVAASTVLSIQIIKIICLRAYESISGVKGLWTYIAQYLLDIVQDGDGRFLESTSGSPRIVDWIMWSLFELLSLHRSPLLISFRFNIQTTLAAVHYAETHSRPSSPGDKIFPTTPSPRITSGHHRFPSARTPSFAIRSRIASGQSPSPEHPSHSRMPSYAIRLTPDGGTAGHARMPSQSLTPFLPGHARMASGARPSFAELSARRASKPVFDGARSAQGMAYRFPSSQPVRQLGTNEKGGSGGAIIHLIGVPSQVAAAAATGTSLTGSTLGASGQAIREISIKSPLLIDSTRKAVKTCSTVFGYEVDSEEYEDAVRIWTLQDALHVVSEQTRILIEDEFRDIFNPSRQDWVHTEQRSSLDEKVYDLETNEIKEETEQMIPSFSVTSA